jgi:hypothetical protein
MNIPVNAALACWNCTYENLPRRRRISTKPARQLRIGGMRGVLEAALTDHIRVTDMKTHTKHLVVILIIAIVLFVIFAIVERAA